MRSSNHVSSKLSPISSLARITSALLTSLQFFCASLQPEQFAGIRIHDGAHVIAEVVNGLLSLIFSPVETVISLFILHAKEIILIGVIKRFV